MKPAKKVGKKEYKIIRVDLDAYEKIKEVEKLIKSEGVVLNPSVSECIRWMYKRSVN